MYRGIISLLGLLGILLFGFAAYAVAAITGSVHLSLFEFFGMLLTLVAVNGWIFLLVWNIRDRIPALMQVAFIIWGGVALWYWTIAPLYYVINMNLNDTQLAWTAFTFLWAVPVIGGGILTTLGTLLFRPIVRAVAEGRSQKDALLSFRRAVQYPARIALLLFLLSIVGYLIGAWQLWQFADMSNFELIKSTSNGPIIAIFMAVIFYVTLDRYVDEYRRKLSRWTLDRSAQFRSLRQRFVVINVAVMIGAVGMLGLLVVQSWQRLQEEQLQTELRKDMEILKIIEASDQHALDNLARGQRGRVSLMAQSEIDSLNVSEETHQILREFPEGVVRDLHEEGKLIAFVTRGNNARLISVAYLTDFYNFIQPGGAIRYGFGITFVVTLTVVVFLYVSYEITRSLVSLRIFAKNPSVSGWGKLSNVHTGDEIESVGRTFLRYVQKVEEADETKREFISIASHQLRTPLTSIRWHVELLLGERDGALNEQQRIDLRRVYESSRRMTQLVNDLLNVSRVDSGRLAVKPQETNLAAFVKEIVDEALPEAPESGCEILVDDKLGDATVWIDQLLLRQVVYNLIGNAIKYRDPERKCTISVGLNKQQDGDFVVTVIDTGIGIPEDEQHRVFEKFWRAENVSTIKTEGTGLGLYVSKMLLDAAGCRISFTSQEGLGTTFQVIIPSKGMQAKPGEVSLAGISDVK